MGICIGYLCDSHYYLFAIWITDKCMGRYYSHWGAGAYQLFIAGLVDRYTDQRIFKTQVQNFRRLQGKIKSMITVNHLVKTYTGRIVVDIAALQINEGEIIGLVGNNGAGKTTFFRLILDLIKADRGE